jgi:signal transduction histidine kinase
LSRQFHERSVYGGDALQELPDPARDLSLRGLCSAVLRSYEGVQGGFLWPDGSAIAGYAFPTSPIGRTGPSENEVGRIRDAAAQAANQEEKTAAVDFRDGEHFVVVVAESLAPGGPAAWSLKRVVLASDAASRQRRTWLAALVLSALLGVGGIVSAWFSLRRGATNVQAGVLRLEEDFNFRLPDIHGDFGQISKAINQMADRRDALEAELRRHDRLAALGKVVAGVAHEIRNPLNSMRLTLELLARRARKGVASPEEVEAAVREIDRLDLILKRLLAFGRPSLDDRTPQDLLPVLERSIRMVQEQSQSREVNLALDKSTPGPFVADIDATQIQQVLINLLLNAIEASPAESTVRIAVGATEKAVHVLVEDSGPGVPPDIAPHIFDAFFTTRPDGTGLGLSVSREIAVNHGGNLELEETRGGATFRLTLPETREGI